MLNNAISEGQGLPRRVRFVVRIEGIAQGEESKKNVRRDPVGLLKAGRLEKWINERWLTFAKPGESEQAQNDQNKRQQPPFRFGLQKM